MSCLVRVGGVNKLLVANWKLAQDETKLMETGSRPDKTEIVNWVENLRQDKTHRNWVETRQNSFVSSASAV